MKIEVRTLQLSPAIHVSGQKLSLNSMRAEALLFYVLLSGEDRFRRDVLATLLWEDKETLELSRANLRQVFAKLKEFSAELGEVLQVGRTHVEINRAVVTTDVDKIIAQLTSDPPTIDTPATQFDIDDLLRDYYNIGTAYQSWIGVYKKSVEDRLREALRAIIRTDSAAADCGLAAADWLLNIDATDEEAVRYRMQTLAVRGQQGEALRTYNELFELLDEEYDGAEPVQETVDLYAAIQLGTITGAAPQPRPAVPVADDRPAEIYISKFDLTPLQEGAARIGRFFRAEVVSNLSRFREWSVVEVEPQSTSRQYQLDCELRDSEGELYAIMKLSRLPQHQIIWADDSLVISFDNWRNAQWKIALQIAIAVNQSLTSDTLRSCLRERPENRTVFEEWVLGADLSTDWSTESSQAAIDLLSAITNKAPHFAPAHSFLAEMYNKRHLVFPGLFRSRETEDIALKHAKTAMRLDTLDCHSHRVLAWSHTLRGDYDVAEFHFQQACALNPTAVNVRLSCALGFAFIGDEERACHLADTTREIGLQPHGFQWGYLQNVYFLAERWDEAFDAGRRAGAAITNLPAWQAAILCRMSKLDDAAKELKRFFEVTRRNWYGPPGQNDASILEWLFHCFPIKSDAKRAFFRDGVEQAYRHLATLPD